MTVCQSGSVLHLRGDRASLGRVGGAVSRYVAALGPNPVVNDFRRLADGDVDTLQKLLTDQMTSGRTKASAIQDAAQSLVSIGVVAADDLEGTNPEHRKAYTKVHSLGAVTWEYFCRSART